MASDNVNQVGKFVKQSRKKADYALGRYKPDVPRIERIRDVFDPANEFSMEFDIKEGEHTVLLDLNFNKPPPTGQCVSDCMLSACEQFQLYAGSHFITLEHPYNTGSIHVYDNLIAVDPANIDETDRGAGQFYVQGITGEGTVIVCYAYSDPSCDFPQLFPNCPDLDIFHATEHVGLAPVFVDQFDRSFVDSSLPSTEMKEPSGGCGYWTGTISPSSSSDTAGAFMSNAVAHFENDRVLGDQWEIVWAGEIFNATPSFNVAIAGATGYGVSLSFGGPTHILDMGGIYRFEAQDGDGFGGFLPGPDNIHIGFGTVSKTTSFFKFVDWFTGNTDPVKYFARLSQVNPGGWFFKIWKQEEDEPTTFDMQLSLFDVVPQPNQNNKSLAFGGIYSASFTMGGIIQAVIVWGEPGQGYGDPTANTLPADGIGGYNMDWCRAAPMDGFVRFGFCSPPGTPSTITVYQGGGGPSDLAWFSWPSFVDGPGLVESGGQVTSRKALLGKPLSVRIKGQVRASTFVDRSWGVTFQAFGLGQPATTGESFGGTTIGGVTTAGNDHWTNFDITVPAFEGSDGIYYIHWGVKLTNSPDSIVATLPRYEPPFLFANNAPIAVGVKNIEYLPNGLSDCSTGNFCPDNADAFDSRCAEVVNAALTVPYFCATLAETTNILKNLIITDGDNQPVWVERPQGVDISTNLGETTVLYRAGGLTDDGSDGRCRKQSSVVGLDGITTSSHVNEVWIKYSTIFDCVDSEAYLEFFWPQILPADWSPGQEPYHEVFIGGQDGGPLLFFWQYTNPTNTGLEFIGINFGDDPGTVPNPFTIGAWTAVRMRTENGRFKIKFWPAGSSEPASWAYDLGADDPITSWGFFSDASDFYGDGTYFKYRNFTVNGLVNGNSPVGLG